MKKIIKNQSGRSMVEMLGVLAIIGVLSIGGIAGYSMAMQKYRTNTAIEAVQLLMTEVRTLFASQADYDGVGDAGADLVANSAVQSPFGVIELAEDAVNVDADGNPLAFTLTMTDVPDSSCVALATANWGDNGSGFVGLSVFGTAATAVPMPVTDATTACANADEGDFIWTFE